MTHEPDYGNRMIYSEMLNSTLGKAEFTLERKDHKPSFVCAAMNRLVAPDSLIPTDGKLKALAIDITGSLTGTIAKAEAAHDYLFTNMRHESRAQAGDGAMRCEPRTPSGLVLVANPEVKSVREGFPVIRPEAPDHELFTAKRHHRIDERRAASGNVARQKRNQKEQGSNRNKRQRIVRCHAK